MENPYQALGETSGESARSQLFGPALGLLVTSVLGVFTYGMGIAFMMTQAFDPEVPEGPRFQYFTYSVFLTIAIAYCGMLALGALSILRTKSYLWAMATAVLALVPILGPCYVLAIPFGIWAIVVLRKPEVRASFNSLS